MLNAPNQPPVGIPPFSYFKKSTPQRFSKYQLQASLYVRAIVLECQINTFPLLTQQPPFIRQHQFSRAEIRPVTCDAIRPSIFRLNGRAWAEFLVASRAITAKQTLINANNSPKKNPRTKHDASFGSVRSVGSRWLQNWPLSFQ